MVKSLQKSAKRLRELNLPHPGILDQEGFKAHFELHCYEPSDILQPFVTHIWTQRQKSSTQTPYQPIEILSGPNVYLFFSAKKAFIHSTIPGKFRYNPHADGVIAGVKFQPGGFYPFLKRPLSEMMDKTIPVTAVFPGADADFISKLLASSDKEIVSSLEALLTSRLPAYDRNLQLVGKIMAALDTNELPQNVKGIAKTIGKSERSLQLLFHTYVGVSLKWVLTRRRLLDTIRQVHTHAGITWTEAAAEQGYSSQSHFTREFKSATGVSPSQYLKATRTDTNK
ncbi:MAG TPA: helix-turn-helix domain-containing protein [Candidatus Saccharimonadales bacterium]|nr:helix-turn-helix domain-containing protein [Candidatus Saccharimonadales bacterium]